MRNDDSITKQIEKLLALAYNNPNKKESESAFRKAYELMIKYKLTKDERNELLGGDSKHLLPSPHTKKKTWREKFANFMTFKKVEFISFDKFFRKVSDEMVTLQIIPDSTVQSGRAVESILNTFHSIYEGFMDRIWNDGLCLVFKTADHVTFRVLYEQNQISFYFVVPKTHLRTVKNSISQVWSKCAINEVNADYLKKLQPVKTVCAYLELKHHFFRSTLVDRTRNVPVESIVSAGRNVIEDDIAVLDVMMIPLSDKWKVRAKKARNDYGKGNERKKTPTKLSDIAFVVLDFIVDGMINKALSFLDVAIGAEPEKDDVDRTILNHRLKPSTEQKWTHSGFETVIQIASTSENKSRARQTLTSIGTSFKDISGDNEFEIKPVAADGKIIKSTSRFIKQMQNSSPPLLRINGNILSTPEMSQILQLPSGVLQKEYPEIVSIKTKEVQIPEELKNGIPIGTIKIKGKSEIAHIPTNNWGMLCRPHLGLGVMFTGKSTLGSRMGHLFPEHGFTSILMDTADGALIDDARDALPEDFPEDHIIDLDIGNLMWSIPSDWNEITSSLVLDGSDWTKIEIERRKASSKLTGVLIDFIDKLAEETSDRMERYLSAVAKAILTSPQRGILEVIMCLSDDNYRAKVLKTFKITDPIVYGTIKELHEMSPENRGAIVRPILTRLNVLMSNDYMRNSILQTPKIGDDGKPLLNLRKFIDGNLETNPKYGGSYFIGIRIPKSELFDMATDRLATFWDAKVWLAALSRYDLPKVNGCHGKPFIYVRDEPHQTPTAYHIHNDACREARKWGMKNVWLAHKLEDFSFMRKTLQDAGVQYSVFSTSKGTIKDLKEELKPFSEEDLLDIPPQGYCVTKLAQYENAFMCETFKIKKIKDRCYLRDACSRIYGRPIEEVEKEIFEKTSSLLAQQKGKK